MRLLFKTNIPPNYILFTHNFSTMPHQVFGSLKMPLFHLYKRMRFTIFFRTHLEAKRQFFLHQFHFILGEKAVAGFFFMILGFENHLAVYSNFLPNFYVFFPSSLCFVSILSQGLVQFTENSL